jgi:hypothetical protein
MPSSTVITESTQRADGSLVIKGKQKDAERPAAESPQTASVPDNDDSDVAVVQVTEQPNWFVRAVSAVWSALTRIVFALALATGAAGVTAAWFYNEQAQEAKQAEAVAIAAATKAEQDAASVKDSVADLEADLREAKDKSASLSDEITERDTEIEVLRRSLVTADARDEQSSRR